MTNNWFLQSEMHLSMFATCNCIVSLRFKRTLFPLSLAMKPQLQLLTSSPYLIWREMAIKSDGALNKHILCIATNKSWKICRSLFWSVYQKGHSRWQSRCSKNICHQNDLEDAYSCKNITVYTYSDLNKNIKLKTSFQAKPAASAFLINILYKPFKFVHHLPKARTLNYCHLTLQIFLAMVLFIYSNYTDVLKWLWTCLFEEMTHTATLKAFNKG